MSNNSNINFLNTKAYQDIPNWDRDTILKFKKILDAETEQTYTEADAKTSLTQLYRCFRMLLSDDLDK